MNRTSTQSWLLPAALCAALLWPWSPAWGATGSVVGRITDASTADSLPGASVYLRQLGRGVAADARGRFEFGGLPAGYYTIEVSAIGYIRWRQENIRVQSGAETTISAALTPTILPLGEEIVVYGKRVLLDVNEPATQRTVEGRDIEKTTAGGLTDVVLQQPGVAQVDREVHVRGARTYETGYLIDGVSVADPFLRQGMAVRPSPAAVESFRVQTGGIDAASGSASAGVVEVETRDPSQQLSGSVSYTTDQVSPVREGRWNSDGAQFVLSGPLSALGLPRLSSDSRLEPGFVLNLSGDLTDTHLGSGQPNSSIWGGTRWAPRSNNRYQSLVKLAWRLSPRHRLVTLFTGETTIDQDRSVLDTHIRTATYSYGWPFAYGRDLANYTTFTRQANSQSLRWEDHGQNNIFTATLARVFSRLHGDVNGKTPDQYVPPQDTGPVSIQTTPDSSVFTINPGDGFYDVGDGDQWYDHFVETYSAKGEWEGRPRPNWTLKPGGSVETQSLQVIDIFRPWLGLGGLNTDDYRARPTSAGLWVQSRFNFQGAVFDFGLRGETWWPGDYLERAVADTTLPNITPAMRERFRANTFKLFGQRAEGWVSPRIGVSFAAGPSSSIFVSYGQFAQRPNPRYLYAKLQTRSPATFQLFGNPALKPERTVAIEGGVKLLRGQDWAFTLSLYQRDIHDYIAATAVIPDPDQPENFWYAYANHDLAQSRGAELTIDGRYGTALRTSAMLAFASVKGEHSLPEDVFRGRQSREGEVLLQEERLDWDKPWRGSLSANWSFGPDDRPRVLGLGLWNNWNLNFSFWAEAGKRYTPYTDSGTVDGDVVYYRAGAPNAKVGPYWSSLDLSWQKYFPIGKTTLTVILAATNVLNHRNVTLVNPLTGKGYKAGDPVPTGDNFFETAPAGYNLPIWNDPAGYENPIHWQMGLKWSW